VSLWRGTVCMALLAAGCENNDLGRPCGTAPTPTPDPVEGETPVVEVVRMERDVDCDSFACLTHRGLHGYCTRTCSLAAPPDKTVSCTTDAGCVGGMFTSGVQGHCVNTECRCVKDSECRDPQHCADGVCRDDDCPKGFFCERVQDVGPLAGQLFCVFKAGCQENVDCEALGTVECRHLGCFDACLCEALPPEQADKLGCANLCTEGVGGTLFHRLHCASLSDACICEEGADLMRCSESGLRCPADLAQQRWDVGAVQRVGMCTPKGF